MSERLRLSRRSFLSASGASLAATALPKLVTAQESERRLVAAPGMASLVGDDHLKTAVWSYDGSVPGPLLRYRQGDRLKIRFDNRLPQETTVHWHGIRLPNAMDGVPHVTQAPVAPGESFLYEFDLPDAGSFWYHPHARSNEQVARGLSGTLIVEEDSPPPVDRELIWVLDDWRLDKSAALIEDFGNVMDLTHAGRIGNSVTLNGRTPEFLPVKAGERIRLRLINVANARIFGLVFEDHRPLVIALDGQPVTPYEAEEGRIVLGPAMRADILLDLTNTPGSRHRVIDDFYRGAAYKLLDIAYEDPADDGLAGSNVDALAANPLAEPDLKRAESHTIELGGGMMGSMAGGMMGGRMMAMRALVESGKAWALNGQVADGHEMPVLLTLAQGHSYRVTLVNETRFHHPMHLHGHAFRVLSRNGMTVSGRPWRDTVLVDPQERVEIAFVADNPGRWMFHCHILEHQEGGMMGLLEVA
ncbi:MAG: multicopper oxidase family protein [Kiloniellales bacterium]